MLIEGAGPSEDDWVLYWATVGSFVLGLITLCFAFWQLRKTSSAAIAARDASREALNKMQGMQDVVELELVCSRAKDLLIYVRKGSKGQAHNVQVGTAADELREVMARYHGTQTEAGEAENEEIERLLAIISDVQAEYSKAKLDVGRIDELSASVRDINESLARMSAEAQSQLRATQ